MPKNSKTISQAELKVLQILWKNAPLNAQQIIDALLTKESWQNRTVKTLLNRLLKKQVIGYQKEANRYFYFPLVKEEDYIKKTSHHFIKRFFSGKVSAFVAHFAEHDNISKKEILEIKAILESLE